MWYIHVFIFKLYFPLTFSNNTTMLLQQIPKTVGTFFVLIFYLMSNSNAQNLMQIKSDSTVKQKKTMAAVRIAYLPQTDSTSKTTITKVVESNQNHIKTDSISKGAIVVLVQPKSLPIKPDSTSKTTQNTAPSPVKDDMEVFKVVEQQPEFEGGLTAFFKYLNGNVQTPPEALKARVDGRAFMSFVVNVDGSISDVTVRRTAYIKRLSDDKTVVVDAKTDAAVIESLNKEAIRVMSAMPKWKPAKNGGQVVKSTFSMPVNF